MSSLPKQFVSLEEYLAMDSAAEVKSQYFDGEMFAMAGGSPAHAIITANMSLELIPAFRARGCTVYSSDLRVQAGDSGLYTYPDMTVVCGAPQFGQRYTLENPTVLFEVLSPSTEAFDRGRKFEMYRRIPSLRAYVLVEQDRMHVEVFMKKSGVWMLSEASGSDALLEIELMDIRVPLVDLYRTVDFENLNPDLE